MSIRNVITISMEASDTTSSWFALNSSFGDNHPRAYQVNLVSGDSIKLDFTLNRDPNNETDVTVVPTNLLTAAGGGIYEGGWRWVRAVKTGTTGAATIKVES